MKLKHFDITIEFNCKCGCGHGAREMNIDFLRKLDLARGSAGIPFIITSGYRCVQHNRTVGGKKTSAHLKGMAADIACANDADRYKIIKALQTYGFNRFGIGKDFIHVDDDPTKNSERIWIY